MSDWTVSELAEEYKAGRLSRRQFIARMASIGFTAPIIASVLAACGSSNSNKSSTSSSSSSNSSTSSSNASKPAGTAAAAAAASGTAAAAAGATFNPTKRGGGGQVKLLWWEAPTILNAHLSNGTKDFDASRIFYEPLGEFDADANLVPVLGAEAPSLENGGVSKDGLTVTWKLKPNVTWHDGKPFTADDVAFTYAYVSNPQTAATTFGHYRTLKAVDAVDPLTVKLTFKAPTPYWQAPFVGSNGYIIPKHIFEPYVGASAKSAPANLKPVGTGPYKFDSFVPGDNLQASIYDNYHVPNRPFFDSVFMKGGGDAVSAARAVLQTGSYDYAWNMQVEYDQLVQFQKGGPGTILIYPGSSCESMQFNLSDPNKTVNGQFSALGTTNPIFGDVQVRQAFNLMFDRKTVQQQLYGKEAQLVNYLVYIPAKYAPSPQTQLEFNPQKGAQMLDSLGWKKGSDGIRAKNGVKMSIVFATSVNSLRQNEQAVIKKTLEQNGIQVQLKSTDASVFFGDPSNPDNLSQMHFDLGMWTNGNAVDPESYFSGFTTSQHGKPNDNIAQKDNTWSGGNVWRYQNPDYDKLWLSATTELDPVKRADIFQQLDAIIAKDAPKLPLVGRNGVSVAKANLLGTGLQPWASSELWQLAYWHRKA